MRTVKRATPFQLVCIDPPWEYRNKKTGGSHTSGASQKYVTLTLEALGDLAPLILGVMAKDAVSLLWVPVPLLDVGLSVLSKWGFKYKTAYLWEKTGRLGMGWWWRGQFEVCLVGTRGKPAPFRIQKPNITVAPATVHSHKPEAFYDQLDAHTKGMRKLELFATRERPGWVCTGKAINGEDVRDTLTRIGREIARHAGKGRSGSTG